jgi:hypothetical protein
VIGERASTQARVIWAGVAPRACATLASRRPPRASHPLASGNHGMNARAAASHASRTGSHARSARLYLFCTDPTGASACATSIVTLERAQRVACRIFPGAQIGECANRLLDGDLPVDGVELVERQRVESKPPQAALACAPEMRWAAV